MYETGLGEMSPAIRGREKQTTRKARDRGRERGCGDQVEVEVEVEGRMRTRLGLGASHTSVPGLVIRRLRCLNCPSLSH